MIILETVKMSQRKKREKEKEDKGSEREEGLVGMGEKKRPGVLPGAEEV
jgi:hypothetical protein